MWTVSVWKPDGTEIVSQAYDSLAAAQTVYSVPEQREGLVKQSGLVPDSSTMGSIAVLDEANTVLQWLTLDGVSSPPQIEMQQAVDSTLASTGQMLSEGAQPIADALGSVLAEAQDATSSALASINRQVNGTLNATGKAVDGIAATIDATAASQSQISQSVVTPAVGSAGSNTGTAFPTFNSLDEAKVWIKQYFAAQGTTLPDNVVTVLATMIVDGTVEQPQGQNQTLGVKSPLCWEVYYPGGQNPSIPGATRVQYPTWDDAILSMYAWLYTTPSGSTGFFDQYMGLLINDPKLLVQQVDGISDGNGWFSIYPLPDCQLPSPGTGEQSEQISSEPYLGLLLPSEAQSQPVSTSPSSTAVPCPCVGISPVIDFQNPFASIAGITNPAWDSEVEKWMGPLSPMWTYDSFLDANNYNKAPSLPTQIDMGDVT